MAVNAAINATIGASIERPAVRRVRALARNETQYGHFIAADDPGAERIYHCGLLFP